MDRLHAALAADAGMLHAAERHHVADGAIGVDPDRPGLERGGHAQRPVHVLGPDAGRQAVDRVVGQPHRFLLGVEADDRQHGAEHFLPGDPHVGAYVDEDGGLDELSARHVAGGAAAQDAARAFGLGDLHVVQDLPVLRRRRDRADVGVRQHRIALACRAAQLGDALAEFLADRVLHQEARARDAGLAGGGEDAGDGARRGGAQVAILEDDVRGLAAQFERHAFQCPCGLRVDLRAGAVGTGEGDLGDAGVIYERGTRFLAVAGDDVEHAVREAGLLGEGGEFERGRRGELRRLHHHRAARGEGRGAFPGDEQQGRIPRGERRHDTDRLVPREGEMVGLVDRHDGALNLVGETAEVAPPFGIVVDLSQHLGEQLAVVAHLDFGQSLRVGRDQIGELHHQLAPAGRRHGGPRSFPQRERRDRHGAVHVAGAALGNPRPDFSTIGVHAVDPFSTDRVDVFAGDEMLVGLQTILLGARQGVRSPAAR